MPIMSKEKIDEFLLYLEDEKNQEGFLEELKNRNVSYEEARLLAFKELLYRVFILENTDLGKETTNYNRDFINQISNEENFVELKINDFVITFKKPFSLGDMKKIKNVVYDTLVEDTDDIIRLQNNLPDFIEIKKNDVSIKDVSRLEYSCCKELFFVAPIIYYSYLFFISAIGGQKKKI